MDNNFINKPKPTAAEYLSASLEDIVTRANKSTSESEIHFVTALLSAKANRDQKRTSSKMFWVAVVTVLIALLSLIATYVAIGQESKTVEEIVVAKREVNELKKSMETTYSEMKALENELLKLRSTQEASLSEIRKISESISKPKKLAAKHNKALNSQASPAGTPQSGAH